MEGDDEKVLAAFERHDEFLRIQNALMSCDLAEEPSMDQDSMETKSLKALNEILDEYQEQSYLLDPYLEELVSPLAEFLRNHARIYVNSENVKQSSSRVRRLSLLLYHFTKFRGYKTIIRFFPHDVGDLSVTLQYMTGKTPFHEDNQWALRYIVLLWMSLVCMLPFDLNQFDEADEPGKTSRSIEEVARRYLDVAGLERDGAAILLSRLLMRKETQAQLSAFLDWFEGDFRSSSKQFVCIGVLKFLAKIAKSGPTELLQQHIPRFHEICAMIAQVDLMTENIIIRRMRIKLLSRLANRVLPARQGKATAFRALIPTASVTADNIDEPEFDVPEDVESVFEELFAGLQDKDTTVRWSSAKGIARVCERLPSTFVQQVLEQILGLFTLSYSSTVAMTDLPSTAEGPWHGACLACAEMARRNLISNSMLSEVIQWMSKALYFDIRKGTYSIGTSVRDAASYVLWSLARAESPDVMRPHAMSLAQNIATVAVYDRETQIRRAASAAFQENVGRMGLFPHGIDVLANTDFYAISIRRHAFLEAAPQVAVHAEYRHALLQHVTKVTLRHWDEAMRQLGAQSLRKICELDLLVLGPECVVQLGSLLRSVDTIDVHGALLGLAELAKAFSESPSTTEAALYRRKIFEQLDLVPSKFLLTQRNAFLIEAACYLISASISLDSITPSTQTTPYWRSVIDHAMKHYSVDVHVAAASAMSSLSKIKDSAKRSPNSLRSVSRVLGVLDYSAFPHEHNAVIQFLLDGVNRRSSSIFADVEARRNAYTSLAQIVVNVIPRITSITSPSILVSILTAFNDGLADYTSNERGDVGSWVRVACVHGLCSMFQALLRAAHSIPAFSEYMPPEIYHRSIAGILKQGVERLDNVRQAAGEVFLVLATLPYEELGMHEWEQWELHERKALVELFNVSDKNAPGWNDSAWLYPRAVRFLDIPAYRSAVLRGLVLSVGSKTASTQLRVQASFVNYVASLRISDQDPEFAKPYSLHGITNDLLAIAEESPTINNVVVPVLQTLNILLDADLLVPLAESPVGFEALQRLLQVATKNVDKLKSIQRIVESMKIVVNLIAIPELRDGALSALPKFLQHKFPKIRADTAETLYTALQTKEIDYNDEAESILLETEWTFEDSTLLHESVSKLLDCLTP